MIYKDYTVVHIMVNIILEYDHSLINKPTVNLPLLPTIYSWLAMKYVINWFVVQLFFLANQAYVVEANLKQVQEISKHSFAERE